MVVSARTLCHLVSDGMPPGRGAANFSCSRRLDREEIFSRAQIWRAMGSGSCVKSNGFWYTQQEDGDDSMP
ncbi:unnamed protein product [Urochloa humidicola]